MDSIVLTLLIAGAVFGVFLILAALVWGIRTRREEGNFVPAPDSLKPRKRAQPDFSAGSGSVPDWLQGTEGGGLEPQTEENVPEWMQDEGSASDESEEAERIPIGAEAVSPLQGILRGAIPDLSIIVDLGRLVQEIKSAGEKMDTDDDRKAAILKAVEQLRERHPDNEILNQVLASLQSEGYLEEEADSEEGIKIIQTPGRNLIHVDGVEYYSLADIPDAETRDEVRRILESLNKKDPS